MQDEHEQAATQANRSFVMSMVISTSSCQEDQVDRRGDVSEP